MQSDINIEALSDLESLKLLLSEKVNPINYRNCYYNVHTVIVHDSTIKRQIHYIVIPVVKGLDS